MLDPFVSLFTTENFVLTVKILYYSSFFWIPALLVFLVVDLFIEYQRAQYILNLKNVVLEIKLPKEIFKSPKAMEFCIAGMFQTGLEGNWYEKYWKGQVRAEFSLEIVSIDGNVHFFIRCREGFKNRIEANLYSQYPGVEIYEVPDYTLSFSFNPEVNSIWASEFKLTKADAFPIKTYIDYGMDKDPKEEYKIDPMTPLIEFLGGLPRGHQAWIQIIVRAHKAEDKDPKGGGKLIDKKWAKAAEEEIDKIIAKAKGEKDKEDKLIPGTGRPLTEIEKDTVAALGRSVSKPGFDAGMRTLYIAPKDGFDPNNIGGIIGGITHFNSSLNGFAPTNGSEERYKNFFLLWKKRSDHDRNIERQDMVDAYKRRAYFHKPYKRKAIFVLNSEELATLFHLPGSVSATPTFSRIESRKSEAPSNLPV